MKNIRIIIAYDGTKYNGWQKQGNTTNTIQQKLEETVSKFVGEKIEIIGSGRTDAGVHALRQVANFHLSDEKWKELQVIYGDNSNKRDKINEYLPMDIKVSEWDDVEERFHSRLNATKKHYSYVIDNGDIEDIFRRKYATRIKDKLDIEAMKKAIAYLIGEHDFKCFCANKKMKKSTVRTIYDIDIVEDKGIITIDFFGNGFLYNMVRIITGTLIEIGLGKRSPEEMISIIDSKDRSRAGYLAPASGLFLNEVFYSKHT